MKFFLIMIIGLCGSGVSTPLYSDALPAFTTGKAASLKNVKKGVLSPEILNFEDVLDRLKKEYVEDLEEEKMIEAAINGMLGSLDPYSMYLNPKRFRNLKYQTLGEFGGIGLEVSAKNGLIEVITALDDTPAAQQGIKTGDLILDIDGAAVSDMPAGEALDRLAGPENSMVMLKIRRGHHQYNIGMKRALIRIQPVRWRTEKNIGYIRITTFNTRTESAVKDAVTGIKDQLGDDLCGMIIDLRNNAGGLLDQAVKVADAFLPQGEIMSTKGRGGQVTQRYFARPGDLANGIPLVILINQGSASGAEIVAGALQDNKRAYVLGERSFGKGSVQKIIPLPNGGALRLTTETYCTPSGRVIQGKGIEPNIVIEPSFIKKIEEDLFEGCRGQAPSFNTLPETQKVQKEETVSLEDTAKNGRHYEHSHALTEQDYQLRRAIDLLMAKDFFKA